MSTAVSGSKLLPRLREPFTPLSTDLFVREQFNVVQNPNYSIPAFGTPHNTISKLANFPDHKFCWQTEPDELGNITRWYVADQPTQNLYNYEFSDGDDWKTITQTFTQPRTGTGSFVYPVPTPDTTYPPPPNTVVAATYAVVSVEEVRIGDPKLDSLYVAVRVTRKKITDTQQRQLVDLDINKVQTETRQQVPAGTAGSAVDASGNFTEVDPINSLWSNLTIRKAQGLAGNAVLGTASRTIYYEDNYTWPAVLNYIRVVPVLANPGDIYSPATSFNWQPIWIEESYDGPCKYTLVERWTLVKPEFGGLDDWNTNSPPGSFPNIPTQTPLLRRAIIFNGVDLQISVQPSLHTAQQIWDTQFYGFYPATTPTRWPSTILARVTVTPDQGGWLTRMFYVDAPNTNGVETGITLTQTAATSTTFTLTWVIAAAVPAGTIKLDVSTDPSFNGSFLSGYQNLTVTGSTLEVVGATRGQIYYARVSRGGIISNICVCLADPQPELLVTQAGQTILDGGTLSVGSAEIGAQVSTTITLNSIGLESVTGITVEITGTDASMFSVSSPPTSLPPTSTSDLTVQFAPSSIGSKTATLAIASNDSASPYNITLTGIGVSPEIQLEQPVGNILVDGASTVDFGTVTTGSADKTFRLTNVGNTTLRQIEGTISGTNLDDYTFSTAISVTELAPSAYVDFVVTFDPVVDASSTEARTATLSITSTDTDESPFTVSLTGVSDSPTAPGALDLTYDPNANGTLVTAAVQPDGKVIIAGSFTSVVSTTRNYIARINTDGTLDSFNPNANGAVLAVDVWPDGTILIAGDFTTIGGTGRNRIALLNADGTLNAWYPTGGIDGSVICLARKTDGKIWVGGSFSTVGGLTRKRIALINADGSINAANPSAALGISIPAVADVRGMVLYTDERLLLCGSYLSTVTWGFVARLNADGTVDNTFIGQVFFSNSVSNDGAVNTVTLLDDGRVIAGGAFNTMSTVTGVFPAISPGSPVYSRDYVIVLDDTGVPTSTLINADAAVRVSIIQANGSVLIGGDFANVSSTARNGIARLESTLVLESAYNPNAGTGGSVRGLLNQEDGKTLVVGGFTTMGGTARNRIARLYNDAATASLTVEGVSLIQWLRGGAIQGVQLVTFEEPAGTAIAGTTTQIGGGWQFVPTTPLSGTGTVTAHAYPTDSHSKGILEDTVAYNVNPEIQVTDGSTILVDAVSTVAFSDLQLGSTADRVITITNIGLDDLDFSGTYVALTTGTQWSVVSQPPTPVAPGASVNFTLRFTPTSIGAKTDTVTITSDDADEGTFTFALTGTCTAGPGSEDVDWQLSTNGVVRTSAQNASDTSWLGGSFTTVNSLTRQRYAAVEASAPPVSVLAQTGSITNGEVRCVCQLPNGQVLIGGSFTSVSGVTRNRIARFNANGSFDATFNVSANDVVTSLALQADGSVVVGGAFSTLGGAARGGIGKLTPAGILDTGFITTTTASGTEIYGIVTQTDGKLLVYGLTTLGGSAPRLYIYRLNANGSGDSTFNASANNLVYAVAIDSSGNILVGGSYTSIGGASKTGLNRLTSVGLHDATFAQVAAAVQSLIVQCDGKVLAGSFTAGSLASTERLVRLSTTGTNDSTFVATARNAVYGLSMQSDGKVIVTGNFTLAGGTTRYLARLLNDSNAATSVLSVISEIAVQWLRGGTVPEAQVVVFHYSQDSGATWTSLGQGVRITGGWSLSSVALPVSGILRAQAYIPCGYNNGSTAIHEEQVSFSNLDVADLVIEYPVGTTITDGGSVSFPGTLPGQTSDLILTLRNTGNATLSSIAATVSGDFSITSSPATSIAANGSTTMTVRFTPTAVGARGPVFLSVTSSLPGTKNPYTVGLNGSGVAVPLATTGSNSAPGSGQRTLNGTFRANHDTATAYFQYKLASSSTWLNSASSTISGFTNVVVSKTLTGLTVGQSYQYRAIIYNAVNAGQAPASPFVGATTTFTAT